MLASWVLFLLVEPATAALADGALAAGALADPAAVPVAGAPFERGTQETDAWARDALTRALAASRDIDDPFHRAQALAEIAEAAVAAGDLELARAELQQAEAEAGRVDAEPLRAWALHDVAMARIKANHLDEAETTADAIRNPRLRDIVLAAVVDGRRSARDVAGALRSARRIQDSARQGISLRSVALMQAASGDISGALATARSISHAQANALAVGDVAAAIARDGSTLEARLLAGRIRDGAARSRAFVEIAAVQAGNGDILGAREALTQIDDKLDRAEALARIAAVRSELAPNDARTMFAEAIAATNSVRGPLLRKCETLIEIARGQVTAKSNEEALAILRQVLGRVRDVKKESDRLTLFSRIAPLQARAGDFTSAFDTAMRAEDPSLRPLLVRDIAAFQVERGDVAGALQAARTLNDRPAAAAAFFGILRAQSLARDKAGMHATLADALGSVRVLRSPELRAGALGSLAAAQILDGNMEAAKAAFAEAMTTAAGADRGQQQAAVYVRIADALANRRGTVAE